MIARQLCLIIALLIVAVLSGCMPTATIGAKDPAAEILGEWTVGSASDRGVILFDRNGRALMYSTEGSATTKAGMGPQALEVTYTYDPATKELQVEFPASAAPEQGKPVMVRGRLYGDSKIVLDFGPQAATPNLVFTRAKEKN